MESHAVGFGSHAFDGGRTILGHACLNGNASTAQGQW